MDGILAEDGYGWNDRVHYEGVGRYVCGRGQKIVLHEELPQRGQVTVTLQTVYCHFIADPFLSAFAAGTTTKRERERERERGRERGKEGERERE